MYCLASRLAAHLLICIPTVSRLTSVLPAFTDDNSVDQGSDRLGLYPGVRNGFTRRSSWWLGRSLVNLHQIDWAVGYGLGGRRLHIVPQLDMVVLVMAGLYRSDMHA